MNPGTLNVEAVLDRLGVKPPAAPTLAALAMLQRSHIAAIAFENLDVLLGRQIDLALRAVEDKLVRRRRGGYCHEHVVLFRALLDALGFDARILLARINHVGETLPPTHACVRVVIDGDAWLADVGLGGGPLVPLALRDGHEAGGPGGWRHRITSLGAGRWQLQSWLGDRWSATHAFSEQEPTAAEIQAGNRAVSTDPASPFVGRPLLIRIDESRRLALVGDELRASTPDGRVERHTLSPDDQLAAIENDFGVILSELERHDVIRTLERIAEPRPAP